MSNDDNNPYRANLSSDEQVPQQTERKKSRGGCFLYGCLFSILGIIVLGITVTVGGYYFIKGQVTKYTDAEPLAMPETEMTEEELAGVTARLKNFEELVVKGTEEETPETVELILSADDLNAMIEQNPEFKGRVHVEIKENQLGGQVSIPTDFLPIGRGRFFNATASFNVALNNGFLFVTLADASIKGNSLPKEFLDGLGGENLVKELNNDPDFSGTIRQLESLEIRDNKIILVARPKQSIEENATQEEMLQEGIEVLQEAQDSGDEDSPSKELVVAD